MVRESIKKAKSKAHMTGKKLLFPSGIAGHYKEMQSQGIDMLDKYPGTPIRIPKTFSSFVQLLVNPAYKYYICPILCVFSPFPLLIEFLTSQLDCLHPPKSCSMNTAHTLYIPFPDLSFYGTCL